MRDETQRLLLAREMAERNKRCGHVKDDKYICLLEPGHKSEHQSEPITTTIPF